MTLKSLYTRMFAWVREIKQTTDCKRMLGQGLIRGTSTPHSLVNLSGATLWRRPCRVRALMVVVFLAMTSLATWKFGVVAEDASPALKLSIVDAVSGQPTPARVEVLDATGKPHVAEDALLVGPGYGDRKYAWKGNLDQALALLSKSIENPYTRTTQFYSTGNSRVLLLPGIYKVKVYKGTEYALQTREVRMLENESVELSVAMSRWVDMPKEGWYSADDHIHISRPHKELNPLISKWMQAEDIHVANLLQFGSWNRFFGAPQYEHGKGGLYREGNHLLVVGQENPRTHFLGHTIVLGAQSPLHFADRYVIYKHFWEEAKRQGALTGYAHWGTGSEAQTGLAIDLPSGLLDFLEVLEASDANYAVWYDILNTGFRLTPTAGTDYGGVPSLPGRERFYTEVKGPLSYEAWLDGIRRGKTFVTNGPVLEFQVQGQGMGAEVLLKKPTSVLVDARVRFDPERDDVKRLEVIQNGDLLRSFPREAAAPEIRCRFEAKIDKSSWLAVRASGHKRGEAVPPGGFLPPYRDRARGAPASLAHSAAIYVTIENTPGLSHRSRAKSLARAWIARLEELEMRLAEDKIQYLAPGPGDDVPDVEHLRRNRPALLQAIESANKHFSEQRR
jgi:hypothetical protein